VDEDAWDDPEHMEFILKSGNSKSLLKISCSLFDRYMNLVPMMPNDWDDTLVSLTRIPEPNKDDDEIPF
jgi:hypothetical protein